MSWRVSKRLLAASTILLVLGMASRGTATSTTVTVEGRLLGSDGRPIQGGFVRPYGPGLRGRLLAASEDGTFRVSFPRTGGYHLALGGVHHQTWFMPLLVESPGNSSLEVQLSAARYKSAIDSVWVIPVLSSAKVGTPVFMTRESTGVFKARINWGADTLFYQLQGVHEGGHYICGTQHDTVVVDRTRPLMSDRSTSCVSVILAKGRPVEIAFDPKRLAKGDGPPRVRMSSSRASRIVAIRDRVVAANGRVIEASQAYRAAGGDPSAFRWTGGSDSLETLKELAAEKDPLIRGYLLLSRFSNFTFEGDTSSARRVLREVPPQSALWSLEWGGPLNVVSHVAAYSDSGRLRTYAEEVVASHADSSVRAAFLYFLIELAHQQADAQAVGRYYTQMAEAFPTSEYAKMAKATYAPDRAIQKRRVAPEFSVTSLHDSLTIHRRNDFQGRYLLIDFWATWCTPCVAELRHLQDAHARFRDRLAILSVSFDSNRETVLAFQKARPMPWSQAFEVGGFAGRMAKDYEILGIPRPVLLDSEGVILATDQELRGDSLLVTLGRLVPEPGERK